MIRVVNLRKTYEGHVPVNALKGVSFEIKQGEFVSIMGPSGSGKSTLLHQLALLDTPTSGQILLDNIDVSGLSDAKKSDFRLKHLGYVFQEYALIPELDAIENTFLPLLLLGFRRHDYLNISRQMLDTVGLSERLHHLIHQLSGGEQQRVAIARALVNKAKILFADEPCANLDTENKGIVLRLMRKVCNELGQTILMVTHEPEQREYSDRVLWLRDGLIEKEEMISSSIREGAIHNGYRTIESPEDYLKDRENN
jgi:putative ABC transport system ATP-binding protein